MSESQVVEKQSSSQSVGKALWWDEVQVVGKLPWQSDVQYAGRSLCQSEACVVGNCFCWADEVMRSLLRPVLARGLGCGLGMYQSQQWRCRNIHYPDLGHTGMGYTCRYLHVLQSSPTALGHHQSGEEPTNEDTFY